MENLNTVKKKLKDDLRAIFELNSAVIEELSQKDPGGNWSYEDLGVEAEFDDVLDALSDRSRDELLDTWHALQRIDRGTYGKCVACSREIDAERLKALPATPYCINCAARLEKP